jgi:hypothetical protein
VAIADRQFDGQSLRARPATVLAAVRHGGELANRGGPRLFW